MEAMIIMTLNLKKECGVMKRCDEIWKDATVLVVVVEAMAKQTATKISTRDCWISKENLMIKNIPPRTEKGGVLHFCMIM